MKTGRNTIILSLMLLLGCGGSGIDKKQPGGTPSDGNNGSDDNSVVVIDGEDPDDPDPDEPADNVNAQPSPVCGDGVVEGEEECEGDAGTTCEELGFDGGTVACGACTIDTSACTRASCGDGVIQDAESCDDGADNGEYDACNSNCSGLTGFCGDGTVNGPEECDATDLGGTTCQDLGFDGGELGCSGTCGYDTSSCATCGNGVLEGDEVCDEGESNGYYGHCNLSCTGLGSYCGDGEINGDEECDGGDVGNATCSSVGVGRGDVACTSDCAIDTSTCSLVPSTGEVIITEVMQNPLATYDNDGEWFEVYNDGNRTVDLEGCTVHSSTSSGPESFEIMASIPLGPGEYGTLARSADAGFSPDYVYGFQMNLNNSNDSLELKCPDPFAPAKVLQIDRISYDDGATFPDPEGSSMTLHPGALNDFLNDDGGNWCEATSTFGLGDYGTPGAPNDSCI